MTVKVGTIEVYSGGKYGVLWMQRRILTVVECDGRVEEAQIPNKIVKDHNPKWVWPKSEKEAVSR